MSSILHIFNQSIPPSPHSGGANRLLEWLAIEQASQGHKVYVATPKGHSTAHYTHIPIPVNASSEDILNLIPKDVTDIEFHGGFPDHVIQPIMKNFSRSIQLVHAGPGGNTKSVYVSKSHAGLGAGKHFAYNGVPVNDYHFSQHKEDYLLFLAKVKRRKKGVSTAIKIAKASKTSLIVAGGHRVKNPETWCKWHPLVTPVGYVNGEKKLDLLSKAKALLVPIEWDEPFGLTVVEAAASGTPVIAFDRGAMRELIVDGETGYLCRTDKEMIAAVKNVSRISPFKCRKHAATHFSANRMYQRHKELLDYAGAGNLW
ncbi:MAG: hypothetical protein CL581_05015 [Alteromonadaceae bacterium]|nr:hypothetical protein [Alteromonadaceae bacterium]MBH87265.1 hypothetical protein [Alteromonadaceae bacterium]